MVDIELKELIKSDKETYFRKSIFKNICDKILNNSRSDFYKLINISRKYRFYKENMKQSFRNKIMFIIYSKKLNKLMKRNNIEIYGNFGKGLKIFHRNIVINNNAVIGDNVILHGNNCIGNNGKNLKAPKIGNNVNIGYGASVIGDIEIADDVIIGANSLVNKSVLEKGSVVCGNPARRIK